MSKEEKIGTIGWIDLTVENADEIKDFYKQVTGWKSSDVSMGGYNDYCMHPPSKEDPVAGICHARGGNKNLPAQWLMYINVENIENSISACTSLGGKIILETRSIHSQGKYCVIEDPAGAVVALFEPQ